MTASYLLENLTFVFQLFPVFTHLSHLISCSGLEAGIPPSTKVRVSFYESQKPSSLRYSDNNHYCYYSDSNQSTTSPIMMMMEQTDQRYYHQPQQHFADDQHHHHVLSSSLTTGAFISNAQSSSYYIRQQSTDSGWENPFRPGGDLSKEADEIVELIKGGKPITPTQANAFSKVPGCENGELPIDQKDGKLLHSSAETESKANGKLTTNAALPGVVEVQVGMAAAPADASQVEHVILKKKRKCQCCVIQ